MIKKLPSLVDLNSKERAFVDLLYYTGIRRGETLALTVSDTNFVNKKVTISKNLVMKDSSSDITPHMFRHTYATGLYYAGIDIKTAQYLLGHSSIQMTLDVYTYLDNAKILSASDKLNAFFDSENNCSDSQNIVSE